MRIWVTGTRGIPEIIGGVETHCAALLPRLVSRGHDVTVGCRRPYMTYRSTTYRGVRLRILGTVRNSSLEAILHTFRCVVAARHDNADILHIHAIGPALAAPFARLLGMKVVVTHHGFDYERAKWGRFARFALRTGERMAATYANHIIAVSPHIADRLREKYDGIDRKISTVPNGVPPQPCSSPLTSAPYILALGRFVEEKGFHTLIEAWHLSGLATKGLRLVIAGDSDIPTPYSRRLHLLAEQHGVEMPGKVTGTPLSKLLSHASLFILPSTHEGLPIALLEAMSYSLPLLASDIPANRIPQLDGDVFFEPDNPQLLAEKLKSFFENPVSRVKYDLSPYDWDKIADATSAIYRSVASPHTR
ncbi:MAG: glycosyltransferase family 4 protein [Muribaculaceae bacterium]|nr:glycosyltransferase family 4 protein [Muribaculaceae bacterium]